MFRILFSVFFLSIASSLMSTDKIKVMLLTGQSNKYHSWQATAQAIKTALDTAGIFDTDTVTSPPLGADIDGILEPGPEHLRDLGRVDVPLALDPEQLRAICAPEELEATLTDEHPRGPFERVLRARQP